jgi:hypothetical protein
VIRSSQLSSFARRSSRHLVDLPCEVVTRQDDEPLLLWATDLSADGAWLEAGARRLALGEELIVCFRPAVWWQEREIMAFAEVARLSRGLRGDDPAPGLGVAFVDLTAGERFALRSWLRPRPERRPARRPGAHRRVEPTHVCARIALPGPRASDHPFASRVS